MKIYREGGTGVHVEQYVRRSMTSSVTRAKVFMKNLVVILCLLGACLSASAQSPYKGRYFALSFLNGQVTAATDIKVKADGSFIGQGSYLNLIGATISGKIQDDGTFSALEHSDGRATPFTGSLSSNGQKLTAALSTGVQLVGKRVAVSFPEAGIYHASTNHGDRGLFLVHRNHIVFGTVYDYYGNLVIVNGYATVDGFSGTTSTGLTFMGSFDGKSVVGTYTDGKGFEGTFSGSRY